jgi:stearoyl-CoA desaturase (delta-9 desaturase)
LIATPSPGAYAVIKLRDLRLRAFDRAAGLWLFVGSEWVLGSDLPAEARCSPPQRLCFMKLNSVTCAVLIWFHIHAGVAVFSISWIHVVVALTFYWIAGGLGICMGYHRLLTHRSFKTFKLFEYFLAICATLALEGGPIFWVATHRMHHRHSDKPEDPHTPRVSGLWAHVGWIVFGSAQHNDSARLAHYAPDLARDPFYRWLNNYHWVPLTLMGVGCLAIGGWDLVNWAICARVVVGLHATWLVNSATHMWGRRRFDTKDDSRNSWWVALLTFGEGWHNNHHAYPTSARHGLMWYEIDLTWIQLRLLQTAGLVWNVKVARLNQAHSRFIAA